MPITKPATTINAHRRNIPSDSYAINSQRICEENVIAYSQRFAEGLTPPPVLIIVPNVRAIGHRVFVLDGFHRLEAARLAERETLPAWVVSQASIDRVLAREFNGRMPAWFCDLDEFILCDGQPYRRPRADGPGERQDEIIGDWSSDEEYVTIEGEGS